ncbi:hypothetical protein BS78_10G049700 [Paspalum vaginatum]|nr:hypothetical protein BS78_10G049700 [Paspalum vaginatum]
MQDGGAGADGGGGNGVQLLLTILADGEEQARQLGELLPDDDGYRAASRRLQCTLGRAVAVARAVEAASASSRGTDRSDSPRSADESSGGTAAAADAQERQAVLLCKRRKGLPRWTAKFRVPDANLEATPDDGLSWRKYGQKDILGAKFPRGYYRCTYRNAQGCPATKQVQRSDADLCVFDVTYQGEHTCHQRQQRHHASSAATQSPLPQPQQQQREEQDHPAAGMQLVVMGFKDVLKVDTTEAAAAAALHGHDDGASPFCFPSVPFVHHAGEAPAAAFSPSAGSGYDFSSAAPPRHCPCPLLAGGSYDDVYDYERRRAPGAESSSELAEVVSRATAPAGAGGLDYASLYQYHQAELDPHLPFPPFGGTGPSHGPYQ